MNKKLIIWILVCFSSIVCAQINDALDIQRNTNGKVRFARFSTAKQSDNTTTTDSISIQISDTLQKSIDTIAVKPPEKSKMVKKQTISPKKQTENGRSIKVMPVKMRENWYRWDRKIIETYLIDSLNEITKNYGTYILINRKSNAAYYYEFPGTWLGKSKIFNFPAELMKLKLPESGIPVIFSAKVYSKFDNHTIEVGIPDGYNLNLTEMIIYTKNPPKQKYYALPKIIDESNQINQ